MVKCHQAVCRNIYCVYMIKRSLNFLCLPLLIEGLYLTAKETREVFMEFSGCQYLKSLLADSILHTRAL